MYWKRDLQKVLPFLLIFLSACVGREQESAKAPAVQTLESLPLDQVRAGGEIGRRIDLAVQKNYLALDLEKDFIEPFRNRRPWRTVKEQADRFKGLGLQIHAAVQFARYTGDPEVIARKEWLVDQTINVQSPSGYIGVFSEEADNSQLWYDWCFHDAAYIVLGLAEDFRVFGHERSLAAARSLADYLMACWSKRPPDPYVTTLGAAEAFLLLHQLTDEERYLRFAADEPMGKKFRIVPAPLKTWSQNLYFERRLTAQEIESEPNLDYAPLDFCHLYRVFERCLMQMHLDRVEPRPNLREMGTYVFSALTSAESPGLLISGAAGDRERWVTDQTCSGRIGENCATVYGMRLVDELLRSSGDLRYGDVIERTIFNTFFASQDPQGRRVRYFTPLSGPREYYDRDAFCCPNNFRRGMGRLPQLIYYSSGDGISVNLFTASSANFELAGGLEIMIRQETGYPSTGKVEIFVEPSEPAEFPLRLRVPRWSEGAKVIVNDSESFEVQPGAPYVELVKAWGRGDRVRLEMGMPARFIAGKGLQSGRAALMAGPLLFCLNPAQNPELEEIELREITLDPYSLEGPLADDSSRPGGLAYRVRGWLPGGGWGRPTDLSVLLTEFPDEGGREVYFRLSDLNLAVQDELLGDVPSAAALKFRFQD